MLNILFYSGKIYNYLIEIQYVERKANNLFLKFLSTIIITNSPKRKSVLEN